MTALAAGLHHPSPRFVSNLACHGRRAAVVSEGETISYAELDELVRACATRLGPQRRLVFVSAENSLEPLVAYLAALRGGHAVLLTSASDHNNFAALSDSYNPDAVITAATDWAIDERNAEAAHPLHPDLALLLSTSGSTGSPKLARLSSQNVDSNAAAIASYLKLTPTDRAITTMPMAYCYGLSVINSHLHVGASIVVNSLSVVDGCFWDVFNATGATSFAGVPHTFDLLDRIGFESKRPPTLRLVTQAGGRLPAEKVRRFASIAERDGWQLFVMYGQTEATARMAYLPPELASTQPQAIGVAIPGGALEIEAPDADGVGELVYRGPNVMLGYAEQPADLALGATIQRLPTGDLALVNDHGLFEIVGRRGRFIKLFGLRIDLDRVESLLAEEGVDATCAGDDEQLIVGVNDRTDLARVRHLAAGFIKIPDSALRVVGVSELPRLPNGKPDYVALRDLATAAPAATSSAPAATLAAENRARAVHAAFAGVLGGDPRDTDTFVSLGGDSLSYVEVSLHLDNALGVLPADWHLMSIGALSSTVAKRGRFAHVEAGVVLRSVAIVLVVGTHARLWHIAGGAHTLLAIAGFNFARFHLRALGVLPRISRIAVPSMCWIGMVAAFSDRYAWPHAVLLHAQLGSPGARWSYWYLEALVQLLVAVGLLMAIPAVRRVERDRPFPFALAMVAAGLVSRFDLFGSAPTSHRISRPQELLWLFALGWAGARAATNRQRLVVSALTVAVVPGFFGDVQREVIVAAGLLTVVWVPMVLLPRRATGLVGTVASASLYIYLSHWQVFPPLSRLHGPVLATVGSIVAGIVFWMAARRVETGLSGAIRMLRSSGHPRPSRRPDISRVTES